MLALLLALFFATPAFAQTFPAFTGFVVDAANVIPPAEEAKLTARLDQFQRTTLHQLAVVSVLSLGKRDIKDFATKLFNMWGVGRRGYNDGVVLLIAPSERKARIAVGFGLEKTLTDAKCAVIMQTRIIPRFKRGDLPGGIEAGVDGIIDELKDGSSHNEARAA